MHVTLLAFVMAGALQRRSSSRPPRSPIRPPGAPPPPARATASAVRVTAAAVIDGGADDAAWTA
ncbi:MAG: DUF58 domain-containing protein, partial [Gemmatimonadaceae bacterium]